MCVSEKELQQLLENDEELVRMAKDMPEIMAVEEEQRTYYARNEELASKLLRGCCERLLTLNV